MINNVKSAENEKVYTNNIIRSKETGITLIALVVTIIVLLILAGVTLSIAIDNGGLIGRARNAKETYKQAEQNDLAALERIDQYVEDYELISFYIYDVEYKAEEGMTWEEWMESDYKPSDLLASKKHGCIMINGKGITYNDNGRYEQLSYNIKENMHYQLVDFIS